jgi:ornithine cyclodeaminase
LQVRVLFEPDIRGLIGPAQALREVREAFVRLARGQATLPDVIGFDVPGKRPDAPAGEVHVKGAYLHGAAFYSIKEAAGFYGNPARGLPAGSGVVLVFDAGTGFLRGLLFDNGYLTDLRTGAAGALAADLLARKSVGRVGILGSGTQARHQLEALLGVRAPRRVVVSGRSPERALAYARETEARFGIAVELAASARQAVEGSDVVITTTPSREPIVRGEWVRAGAHITAVGSDGPDKHEVFPEVLARADKVVADRLDQCLRLGEIHHAVASGLLAPGSVHGELGEIAAGLKPGRTRDDEITVADLTGVGIQDTAVAGFVLTEALRQDRGRTIEI